MHDLCHVSWVELVPYRFCTAPQNGSLGSRSSVPDVKHSDRQSSSVEEPPSLYCICKSILALPFSMFYSYPMAWFHELRFKLSQNGFWGTVQSLAR